MTLMEMLRGHYNLWMEVSRIMTPEIKEKCVIFCPDKIKEIALKNIGETEHIESNCYCCEYSDFCSQCPIKWEHGQCMNSEYFHFCNFLKYEDFEMARRIAARIANLSCEGTREIQFEIVCLERTMTIVVEEEEYDSALKIIDEAYTKWCQIEENPELQFECCEEYILSQLDEAGIDYVDKGSELWEVEE